MDNDQFEKRMELLKKAYDRVPSSFHPDEVFKKIDETKPPERLSIPSKKKRGIRQHVTAWAVGISCIFLIGLIGTGVVVDQNRNANEQIDHSVPKKEYIEELKKKFEVEKEKRQKELALDDHYFDQYVQGNSISILNHDDYVKSVSQNANANDRFYEDYLRAVEQLKTPAEMIDDLLLNPLSEDEEKSIEFLIHYRKKLERLSMIYNAILTDHKQAIDSYEMDPTVDKALIIMDRRNQYPDSLQSILSTMSKQSFQLRTSKRSGEIKAHYYNTIHHDRLYDLLHHSVYGYIQMLVEEPYTYGGYLEYPLEETPSILSMMEGTLMTVEEDSTLYPIMKAQFTTLFNVVLKGDNKNVVFDENGVLLSEYQEVWRKLADSEKATPLTYVMKPIVEEMEASNWRSSKTWDRTSYYAVEEALVLYKEGQLERFMNED